MSSSSGSDRAVGNQEDSGLAKVNEEIREIRNILSEPVVDFESRKALVSLYSDLLQVQSLLMRQEDALKKEFGSPSPVEVERANPLPRQPSPTQIQSEFPIEERVRTMDIGQIWGSSSSDEWTEDRSPPMVVPFPSELFEDTLSTPPDSTSHSTTGLLENTFHSQANEVETPLAEPELPGRLIYSRNEMLVLSGSYLANQWPLSLSPIYAQNGRFEPQFWIIDMAINHQSSDFQFIKPKAAQSKSGSKEVFGGFREIRKHLGI